MSSVGEDMEQLDPHTLLVGTQLWKTVLQFLIKLNIDVLYDPATVPLLGIYQRKMKLYVHTKRLYTGLPWWRSG